MFNQPFGLQSLPQWDVIVGSVHIDDLSAKARHDVILAPATADGVPWVQCRFVEVCVRMAAEVDGGSMRAPQPQPTQRPPPTDHSYAVIASIVEAKILD